jgi:hypothetical protein
VIVTNEDWVEVAGQAAAVAAATQSLLQALGALDQALAPMAEVPLAAALRRDVSEKVQATVVLLPLAMEASALALAGVNFNREG